jgi:CHC2 zinc finger
MKRAQFLRADDVKLRADVVRIAGRYTALRRSGGQLVGRCPFHSERHPSFYVHPEKKIFYCFGCNTGGDVIDFVMWMEELSFSAALQWISDDLYRTAISSGVARDSDLRSRSRFGASEGASPPAAKQLGIHSQSLRNSNARAQFEATEQRLRVIQVTNCAASAALATACEPRNTYVEFFTCQKPDNLPGKGSRLGWRRGGEK